MSSIMEEVSRTSSWAKHFDHLLHDKAGLATFTEFLKKAYCQENIYFWIKCEDYKTMNDDQRKDGAIKIYKEHVDLSASEQINIDENTRLAVERGIAHAAHNLFDHAQKHIYMMLQQDSYKRFLKSDLYLQAVLAESEQRSFPFSGEEVGKVSIAQQGKIGSKEKTSFIPIPSKSSSQDDKKLKRGLDKQEKHSASKKPKNTAQPDIPIEKKEKSSGNTGSGGFLGFLRRRSLGDASKGKSLTKDFVSSPTISKSRIPTMLKSRSIHPSTNILQSGSAILNEHRDGMPSIPENNFVDCEAGTYSDVVRMMCMKENWNGVIKPFSDDFDNDKYTRTTVLRRRTDGNNPGGVIPTQNDLTSFNLLDLAIPSPSTEDSFAADKKLGHNLKETKTACKSSPQLGLLAGRRRSDSTFKSSALLAPHRRQCVDSNSSANANSDVKNSLTEKKKNNMSFGAIFSGRKSSTTKTAGRRSIDSVVVKKEIGQMRHDDNFGKFSSKINKRHSMETLLEF